MDLLCGVSLCAFVLSVVQDFKTLTTGDTEFHRGKTQRSKFSLQHSVLEFLQLPLRCRLQEFQNERVRLARF
jgi:hypothetical protein